MMNDVRIAKAKDRLEHVKGHLEALEQKLPSIVAHIEQGTGNLSGCLLSLRRHAEAKAIVIWFEQQNIAATKQWFYTAARLDELHSRHFPRTHSPGARVISLLAPLVSDCESIINRYKNSDSYFDAQRRESSTTQDFIAYQSVLALRGEWEALIARCKRFAEKRPKSSSLEKFWVENDYFFALANGDVTQMNAVLEYFVSAKGVRARSNEESGFTEHLISSYAVVYAKIARRHSYPVKVTNQLIPEEWLLLTPSVAYEETYAFMRAAAHVL